MQDRLDPNTTAQEIIPLKLRKKSSYTSVDVHQLLQHTVNQKSNFLDKVVVVNPNKSQIRKLK